MIDRLITSVVLGLGLLATAASAQTITYNRALSAAEVQQNWEAGQ